MSIGTRIIQLRNQKGMTQRDISERTGLAGSYLSRIENRHLEPRPHTLRKIAKALGVPISELFQEGSAQLKPAEPRGESYSPRQLELLRMANYLIQTADVRLLDSLDVLLGALLNVEQRKARGRTSISREQKVAPPSP
jgi:transcriptional regulator with XRE-family HTH domain